MSLGAHIAAGLIVGKITGNYPVALASAILVDIDHIIPFIKHGIIFDLKKLWKTIIRPEDPYGNQRNYLHSFFMWFAISIIGILVNYEVGFVICLGYLAHLILDLLDSSDFYPLYPYKLNIKCPISYFSKYELVTTVLLFLIFFLL
ncbi:metal-dependent hydrolase [Patescibacteria group bacterium AH-259-L07]|nr:metal-dependent hydrolase [Patescibacteria group bacterium AH-259-L07]